MKRTSLEGDPCPVSRSLDAIGDWWSLLIIRDAFDGVRRFGEFQKSLGIAKNILSARLRMLLEQEILEAVPASDGSAYQEYVLTPKGRALFHVIVALRQWGEAYFYDLREARSVLIDREQRKPVRPLELRAADGRLVGPDDVTKRPAPERAAQEPAAASASRRARRAPAARRRQPRGASER